jgi:hypothetical protein
MFIFCIVNNQLMHKVICFLILSMSLMLLWVILVKNFDHGSSMYVFGQLQVMCSNGNLVSSSSGCPPTDECPSPPDADSVARCTAKEITLFSNNYGPNSTKSGAPTFGSGPENDSLTISTDKQIYNKGEVIKVTVQNNSTTPMKLYNTNSLTIRNMQTGESYPPSSVPIRTKILLPGESSMFEWDQDYPGLNSSKLAKAGNYTVSVSVSLFMADPLNANTTFAISQ